MSWMWIREHGVRTIFLLCASTSILIVLLIILFLLKEGFPIFKTVPLGELLGPRWYPTSLIREEYGMMPLIAGSLWVTMMAVLIALPFGVVGAVYIAEVAAPREREILKPVIELLAAIPSVVLGFFGLVVLGPAVKWVFGLDTGLNAFTGALLLALMAIPTIVTISEDAIRSVPQSYKDASLALGASHLETTWKVTVPAALSGIIAAVMLGMGRVIGETMAVMMCTGNAAIIPKSPFDSARTMTATIAAEMGEVAFGSTHYQALFCVGVLLLLMTLTINLIAQKVLGKYQINIQG